MQKLQKKGLDKDEIVGAGVGVPGPADEEGNVPVAVNLHWGFVPLSKRALWEDRSCGARRKRCQCGSTW